MSNPYEAPSSSSDPESDRRYSTESTGRTEGDIPHVLPFEVLEGSAHSREPVTWRRAVICCSLAAFGLILGLLSLPFMTNAFGNSDTMGLVLLGFAAWLFVTGISYIRFRFRTAALLGIVAVPWAIASPSILIWFLIMMSQLLGA